MNENKFSQVIKKLRKEKGLTQQELANIVGITATGVSYWESGNAVPNTETLTCSTKNARYARFLPLRKGNSSPVGTYCLILIRLP